jgi:2-keto-4-pentenoate hydratase/2-oxohepta-3-ene-1,7-dioic acid hydratase in catechol pathway
MKICTYQLKNSLRVENRMGILLEEHSVIVDPNLCFAADYEREGFYNFHERAQWKCPTSVHELLERCDEPIELLEEAYGLYLFFEKIGYPSMKDGTHFFVKLEDASLETPLQKIPTYRDFYAHLKHVEVGFKKRNEPIPEAWFEIPAYYKGATNGFIGPNDNVPWPSYTDILDYELELGMVIGKDGINIKESDAIDHIFGFTVLNDISARDIQKKEMAVRLGPAKGKDFCTIIGPVITTIDEFDFKEPNLLMTAKVNGEEWSRGHSADSHYTWAQMIHHVAKDEWVRAGDLFGSGTVGTGCGLELGKWPKSGDTLELFIEGIGTLTNTISPKREFN